LPNFPSAANVQNCGKEAEMNNYMKTPMVLASVRMVVMNIEKEKIGSKSSGSRGSDGYAAIFHSDRGSQYTSNDFRNFAAATGFTQSMSYAGSGCGGNSPPQPALASPAPLLAGTLLPMQLAIEFMLAGKRKELTDVSICEAAEGYSINF
jgi:hypothetical protein